MRLDITWVTYPQAAAICRWFAEQPETKPSTSNRQRLEIRSKADRTRVWRHDLLRAANTFDTWGNGKTVFPFTVQGNSDLLLILRLKLL